ncbi:MAG: TLC domain-containing protein [Monoraphidium minutum]|nr:MAG: TLC domain-containing protein [Monoraphidium minutum]
MAGPLSLRALLPPLEGGLEDMLLPIYQGLALLALRVAAEQLLVPRLKRALKVLSGGEAHGSEKRSREVIENAFLAAFMGPMSVWGWWVLLRHNGPCTPAAPKGCLVGWPAHPMSMEFRWWWLTLGGMYTAEMLGTAAGGLGFMLSREMVAHHAVTIVMMLYGYYGGLHRYGLMATVALDTSNVFLHAAKAAHAAGLPQLAGLKDGLFKAFALVFLVVRVILPPFAMIAPGLWYGTVMPTKTYLITNALMMFIYSLQIVWFRKILKIAGGAKNVDKRVTVYTPTPGTTPVGPSPRVSLQGGACKAE